MLSFTQLFTHEKPYNALRTFKVINKKQSGALPTRPRDALVLRRGLDDRMWELLCRCWSKAPESRPLIDDLIVELQYPLHY